MEESSFSFESYTNLVCNKEIEVSMPESVNFVPDEIFLDCEVNQEDIVTDFGFTFDVPQLEQTDDQGNAFDYNINKGSRLPHSDLVNIHDSSKSASGTCEKMILAKSLHFLVSFNLYDVAKSLILLPLLSHFITLYILKKEILIVFCHCPKIHPCETSF